MNLNDCLTKITLEKKVKIFVYNKIIAVLCTPLKRR
jgi:hypothetical protein